jgi:hypothetical protein
MLDFRPGKRLHVAQYAGFDKRQYGALYIGRGRSRRAGESAEEDPMQSLVLKYPDLKIS